VRGVVNKLQNKGVDMVEEASSSVEDVVMELDAQLGDTLYYLAKSIEEGDEERMLECAMSAQELAEEMNEVVNGEELKIWGEYTNEIGNLAQKLVESAKSGDFERTRELGYRIDDTSTYEIRQNKLCSE